MGTTTAAAAPRREARRGRLIAFEGPEGAGKTTQIDLAASALRISGYAVCVTYEPGGTAFGQKVRDLVMLERDHPPSPLAELFLYLADRAQHVEETIRPALEAGEIVLTDRFSPSTLAYQGFGRGLDLPSVEAADAFARGGLWPDLVLLFDLPVEIGLERAQRADRFHDEEGDFHARVLAGFHSLARRDPERWRIIDATGAPQSVHDRVMSAIREVLPR